MQQQTNTETLSSEIERVKNRRYKAKTPIGEEQIKEDAHVEVEEVAEPTSEAPDPDADVPPLDYGEIVRTLPGLVGDIARYGLEISDNPQPNLALCLGLEMVAAIVNRHVYESVKRNFAQFYAGVFAPGGVSKGLVMSTPWRIFSEVSEELGWLPKVTTSKQTSESAIIDLYEVETAAALLLLNEAQDTFIQAKAQAKYGGGCGFKTALKNQFDATYGWGFEATKAAKQNGKSRIQRRIPNACLSVVCAMQNDTVQDAFETKDFTDGFLSRFQCFVCGEDKPGKMAVTKSVPKEIITCIADILNQQTDWRPVDKDKPNGLRGYKLDQSIESTQIGWSDDAFLMLDQFHDYCANRADAVFRKGRPTGSFWRRCNQHAMRNAVILAAGRCYADYRNATIEVADFALASEIAVDCMQNGSKLLENRIQGTPHDALRADLRRYIAGRGKKGTTLTDFCRHGGFGDAFKRNNALADEVTAGFIKCEKIGGKLKTYYITSEGRKKV